MGTFKGVPLWVLLVILSLLNVLQAYDDYSFDQTQQTDVMINGPSRISFIQTTSSTPVIKAINTAHNSKICSTWGNFHFKNFDGDVFYFPGTCNYVFSSHCKSAYESFNIQIRRTVVNNVATIDKINMKMEGLVVQLDHNNVMVDDKSVQLPFSGSGVQIDKNGVYLKVNSKLGLVFMWNDDDSLLLELDEKYANETCGLCGDYNGISINNEFISNGIQITETQFGNLQKLDGPTEQCQEVLSTPRNNCTDYENICEGILMMAAFSNCHSLVGVRKYIEACVQDLCRCDSKATAICLCNTFAEYSRQCAHAGGEPQNWRSSNLCPKTCPYNMKYQECGSPCADTCSNPERSLLCENHCLEGCFCPSGTVFDDINNSGCVPVDMCSCTFNGKTYAAGTSYSTECSTCMCSRGKWNCQNVPCPSTCAVEGGSHITTYDQTRYTIHGDCNYVLSKVCSGTGFTILAELRKCGLSESETCLKSSTIILNGGETIIVIKPCGSVYVNNIYTQLPVSAANVTIFRPSSFYIIVESKMGVQVVAQLTPFMQVYLILDPSFKTKTCGLCGNFNDKQSDDFQTISGVIEGTAASFANTWKTRADCPNVKNVYEDPCSLSVENEKFAKYWCGLIADLSGPFAECHSTVNPIIYKQTCMFDTCNCEKSEDCMCAAISSYVRACAAKGVMLSGWRSTVCSKYMNSCPKTLNYTYSITTCQPTCRSLGEPDVTCDIKFFPVDGCTCTEGYYMDDSGKCVPAAACPCYYKGSAVPSGEVVHDNGVMCTCTQGQLSCIGSTELECKSPMVYFDCKNASVDARGAECQKSCQTLDMECYRTKCVSGCVCPEGLVADGKGGCTAEDQCPCIHNDLPYQPGEQIKMKCNTCTCKDRMWQCTNEPCLGTCAVYGDGHYITFDGKRYSFNGNCEYTLAQDHCGQVGSDSTFRVITENVPCGTTGTTCSKAIKVFLNNYEMILTEEHIDVLERGIGGDVPYTIRRMGIYLIIEADNGLILMWDQRTSIFIKLSKEFEGKVCGLCGNFDGDGNNDFTTRSMSVVGDAVEFGNSWKLSPMCPNVITERDACSANPYRKAWAQKQCSIINSKAFSACRLQVDPSKYYDACVADSCACDTGGDCECFCTAVAAYAQACGENGVCVSWRTPSICPMFCDYYNPEGECEWHYKPCGAPCMKTCRNPSGKCLHELSGLEGCYPSCPGDKPFFDEDEMVCVVECSYCYDDEGNHYKPGSPVTAKEKCQSCECTISGFIECKYNRQACNCEYQGRMYDYNDVIYNTTDGIGGCITAICKENGTVYRDIYPCNTPTTTPFTFTTTPSTGTTTSPITTTHKTTTPSTTPVTTTEIPTTTFKPTCTWSSWIDVHIPGDGMDEGDFETYENIHAANKQICQKPDGIQCRAENYPETPIGHLGQVVQCNVSVGLVCKNEDQEENIKTCLNYQVKVLCCSSLTTPETSIAETTTIPKTTTTTKTTSSLSTALDTATTTPIPETSTSTTTTTPVISCGCQWSNWFDVSYPKVGTENGDFEIFDNIRARGYSICNQPTKIECRAIGLPDTPLHELGQNVQCNASFGLLCYNKDQVPPICYNYEIRVCCSRGTCTSTSARPTEPTTTKEIITTTQTPVPPTTTPTITAETTTTTTTVPPTTRTTTTTTTTQTTTTTTRIPPTPTTTTTTTPKTTTAPTTTKVSTITPNIIPETTTTTTTPTTTTPNTSCGCQWSTWFDVSYPKSGIEGGDFDTFDNIRAKGYSVCNQPSKIECRAKQYPDTPLQELGQKVQCNASVGLLCYNKDQVPAICYNYEIRVCCSRATCTTTGTSTTSPTTTKEVITTTKTPIPPTSTPKTIPEHTSTTTTTPPTTTSTPATTTKTTTPTSERTTTTTRIPPPPTPTTTTSTTPETTTTTTRAPTTTKISTITPNIIPETTTTTTTPTTTTPNTSCGCQWSTWFDVSYPKSGIEGGDFDTFDNIRAKGYSVCNQPSKIECRAKQYPDTPLQELGQKVQCNASVGLLCYNKDQVPAICYNYEIRVCCSRATCTTTSTSTTSPTTTKEVITTTKMPISPTSTPKTIPEYTSTTTTAPPTTTSTPATTTKTTTPTSERTTTTTRIPPPPTPTTTTSTTPETTTTTTRAPTTTKISTITPNIIPETTTTTTTPTTTTPNTSCGCQWSTWFDVSYPKSGIEGGDFDTFDNIRAKGYSVCNQPSKIECRAKQYPDTPLQELGQKVQCNASVGLLCYNKDQVPAICYNYEIRVCCSRATCTTTGTSTTSPTTTKEVITTTKMPISPTSTPKTIPEYTSTTTTAPPTTTSTPATTTKTTTPTSERTTTTTRIPPPPTPTTTTSTTPETTTTTTRAPTTTKISTITPNIIPETTATTTPTTTTPNTSCGCQWSTWFDVSYPKSGIEGGDFDTFDNIRAKGYSVCNQPSKIECRAKQYPDTPLQELGQKVQCNASVGLLCYNKDQVPAICYNYEIRVCCSRATCTTTGTSTTSPTTTKEVITTTKMPISPTSTPKTIPEYTSTTTTAPPTTTSTPATTTKTTTPTSERTTTTTRIPPPTTPTTTTSSIPEATTTTAPTTTKISTITPNIIPETTTTTTTPTTTTPNTSCGCQWSTWFDVSYPKSGIEGGDFDTFDNIRAKGYSVCNQPSKIECRAKQYPDTPLQELGQKVQCNASVGLLCYNKDQVPAICYNYEIRVCCSRGTCTTTPQTTTITPELTTTEHLTTKEATQFTTVTTTRCYCRIDGEFFLTGAIIYNRTDEDGCHFYAICNEKCNAERFQGPCQPTTLPPPTTTTTPVSTTTTSIETTTPKTETTTPVEGCPPRKTNETWPINNCTVAKCHGNNVVTFEPVSCPPVEKVTCDNGFPPVKVYSADGCCYHYECECVCAGWGDPHYITFDGTYYTFLDNCTYVLVQQITPKFDNFRVLVDNYFCDAADGLSCPESLIIYYKSNELLLTRTMFQGRMRNMIRFNQNWVTPGFTADGIIVSSAGINMVVEIPEINAYISFSGLIFFIKLPFSMFGYNTEGQCGTCSNNSTEDCRLPDGEVIEDCSQMAAEWRANFTVCNPPPEPTPTPSVPPTDCPATPLCDVILSEVFAECHQKISPEPYHKGCVYDACRISNYSVQCSSLEVYAAMCASIDVCVDWRGNTEGHCPYYCPAGKVYDPCGPVHCDTCENREVPSLSNGITEGCYCPSGTKLFNTYTDVCVKSCPCVGPDGMPKAPAEKWISNCQECVCEATSLTVQCTPLKCVQIQCAEGFEYKEVKDQCCGICEPVACTMKMTDDTTIVIKPGETWNSPVDKCSYYQCNKTDEQFVTVSITKECTVSSADECRPGYTYRKVESECCGTCVQEACTMMMKDNSTKVLEPEETWTPPNEPCLYYECHKIGDQFVPTTVTRVCSVVECSVGYTYIKVDSECCGTCKQEECTMKMKDNSTKVLKPGEKYTPPDEKCISYICTDTHDVVTEKDKCVVADEAGCSAGYNYTKSEDECCGKCVPVACTMKMKDDSIKVLKPDEKYTPVDEKCTSYICTETYDLVTEKERCLVVSPTDCSEGYNYTKAEGDCCGKCEPVACTMKMSDNSTKVLKPEETWTPPNEPCLYYECHKIDGQFVPVNVMSVCSVLECSAGYMYKKAESECCGSCEMVACTMKMDNNTIITLMPGEKYTPPDHTCTSYTCNSTYHVVTEKENCKVSSPADCSEDFEYRVMPGKCCGECVKVACTMKMDNNTTITLKSNETWSISNCTVAKCHENNVVTIEPVTCKSVEEISCASGFPSVKVYDSDGCCYHYECECVCTGWGDPHYVTFDGTYYTFLDNCTYVLVQQITPKFDNFRVLIDNYLCDADDGLSCPQSIIVYYKSHEVLLTRTMFQGRMRNRIRFNQIWVTPGFTIDGITVSSAGINMVVEIPEIKAYISFSGMIFVVKLPFSMFGYNTEGQCGTCSNNSTEDCRLPDGEVIEDCSEMANHWRANVTYCNPPPEATPTPPVPPTECPPAPLCDVILSEVFAECHKKISPEPYHEGCVFDACRISNYSVQCSSLEIYAALCASIDVCVDWRAKTGDHCPYNCPAGKMYDACGPVHADTCDNRQIPSLSNGITEGCYCPSGTKLFNAYTDVCVESCTCVGPDGMPKASGEKWTSNCQECFCEATSLTVQCTPLKCDQIKCAEGFQFKEVEDQCCGGVCEPVACTMKMNDETTIVIKPGETWNSPVDKCSYYQCNKTDEQFVTMSVTKECTVSSADECRPGYKYSKVEGECCGICDPVACTMMMNDSSTKVLEPEETWTPPNEPCLYYECHKIGDQFVPITVTRVCTIVECGDGYNYTKVESECCGTCVPVACTMKMKDNSVKVLKPGEKYTPADEKCTSYICTDTYDVITEKEKCLVISPADCSEGYTYKEVEGDCCGSCVPEACTMKMKDDSIKVLKPGEKYTPADEKCTSYICTEMYNVVTEIEKCVVLSPADCSEGYKYAKSEGECCGTCVPEACTMKMMDDSIKVLKPGEKYTPPDEKCVSYICTDTYDVVTEREKCIVVSPTDCSEGYRYKNDELTCCGTCEQVACTMKMKDNSTKILKPEETWTPSNEPCLYYECHKIEDQFVPVTVTRVCSVVECSAGYMFKKLESECCGLCVPSGCTMKMDNNTIITLKPGEKYTPLDQNCVSYTCNDSYHVVTEKENCPVINPADCLEGFEYKVIPGKCCGECVKEICTVKMDDNTSINLKTNETWSISNCTVAKCHGNDVVTIEPVTCPPVEKISCENGFPPVKVYNSDGCCYHYQCECVCTGWGDPHYVTFDGTYYTFLDNCTYVLVQQITPKFDNFRVLIDNFFCDAEDGLSCPQSIIVYYKSHEVLLTRTMFEGRMRNRIRFNQHWVTPGFTIDGITVSSSGINMVVEIPEINAYISFSGMIFVIKLPFSMFGYNTEGQCGTCSNNSTEDCRLPDGEVVADCSEMATQWRANVTYCNPPPEATPTPPVPPTECPPAPLCDVILSEVFADCHEKISPEPYYEGCVFDACRISNYSVQCSSLEVYAALCASIDVCVDWRGKSGGHCPYDCPAGKVYNPCGPVCQNTCENRQVPSLSNKVIEGCYCPSDTTLFNTYSDVCVKSCACVGPDGMPREPSEKWTSNCQECFCEATSLTVQCTPLNCDQVKCAEGFQFKEMKDQCCGGTCEPVACTMKMNDETTIVIQPGETWNSPVDKCSYYQCNKTDEQFVTMSITKECTVSSADECKQGYTYKYVEGECCGTCVQEACTMKMKDDSIKDLKPGEKYTPPDEKCVSYICTDTYDVVTEKEKCLVVSPTDCSEGSKYTKAESDCCGSCVAEACTMAMKDNSTKVLQPGERYTLPEEKCTSYICTDTYDVITEREKCLVLSAADCSEGYKYTKAEGDCCGLCEPVACTMKMKDESIKVLQPGEKYTPADEKCTSYICTETYNVVTEREKCLVASPSECSEGYTYSTSEADCCGKCVPVACTMKMQDNSIKVLKPGEKYTPADQKCTSYICTDTYDLVTEKEKCLVVSPADCTEGFNYTKSESDCCGSCVQEACTMKMNDNSIKVLKPDEKYTPADEKCTSYICTETYDLVTEKERCLVVSPSDCSEGSKYTQSEGECCGLCEPVACTMKMKDSSIKVLQPGEKYTPADEKCTSYICTETYSVVTEIDRCLVITAADCSEGYKYTKAEGDCCGSCEPVACTMKMKDDSIKVLQPGEKYTPADEKCTSYICTETYELVTEKEKCLVISPADCTEGYTYSTSEADCCGKCVPVACTMKMQDNSIKVLKPGEKYTPVDEKCTSYICTDTYDLVTEKEKCLVISPADCTEGFNYTKSESDCCGSCVQEACTMKMNDNSIKALKPGEKYTPADEKCTSYICTETYNVVTEKERCLVMSPSDCSEGYKYTQSEGECCGLCEPVACTMKMKDSSIKVLQPGEKYTPADEKCTSYICTETYNLVTEIERCLVITAADCSEGYKYTKAEGDCCGSCEPVACTMKMKDDSIKVLQPGEKYIPADEKCTSYICTETYSVVTEKEKCLVISPADCSEGYTYKQAESECCGSCDPVACTMKMKDNSTKVLQPGEKYIPPDEKCTSYICTDAYDLITEKETCPAFNLADCLEGTIKMSENGCCKTCEPIVSSCQVHKQSTRIRTGTCESDQTLELSYCEGGCKTTSMYSAEANTMEHKCSCCQEMKTSKREVSLKCLDGTSSLYSYIYVEECGCTSTECDKDPKTSNGLK